MLSADIISVSVLRGNERRTILQNTNFNLEYGKIYSILGKNGSGKSTLIKSLTSLLTVDQYELNGKVFFEGTDLLNTSKEKLREIRKKNIRYVFQDAVGSFDPLKKMKYNFDLSEVEVTGIEEQLNYFLLPEYKKISNLYSYELSGGMAQRLLIVLALLANPGLLILDEPTSGVDYALMNLIILKLKEFVKGKDKSALIVTQDINFAIKSSDYIAYLSNGKLGSFQNPDNFIKSVDDSETIKIINSFKELNATA